MGLSPMLLAARAEQSPVPRALASRVAARIAADWQVPAAAIRLEWGRRSSSAALSHEAPFQLLGRGTGGWFVVVFDPSTPQASALRVRAGVELPVAVAARPLLEGQTLSAGDLTEEVRVHWGAPDAMPALGQPGPGWLMRRAVASGEVVAAPAAAPPPDVLAGEPVRFEWRAGDVQVSVVGIALHAARRGERLRARLEERPTRLEGRVTAPGRAELEAGAVR